MSWSNYNSLHVFCNSIYFFSYKVIKFYNPICSIQTINPQPPQVWTNRAFDNHIYMGRIQNHLLQRHGGKLLAQLNLFVQTHSK